MQNEEQLREPLIKKELLKKEEKQYKISIAGTYIHILADFMTIFAVIMAAVIISIEPEFNFVDPICTYLVSVIIACTSIPVFKDCLKFVMKSCSDFENFEELENDIRNQAGVKEVSELHVLSISSGKFHLSCHIISSSLLESKKAITHLCRNKHKINHITIQFEDANDN